MADILRRSLAPIADEAWKEIDKQAARILKGNLSGRGLVDFSGPHGWVLAAVNLGRVKAANTEPVKGVAWGAREVLPLAEVRVPFSLKVWELDNVSRGAKDPDLNAMIGAARKLAIFEEKAVYHGFKEGGIGGMLELSSHKAVPLAKDPAKFVGSVEGGILSIQKSGIGGPYALVLGTEPYELYMIGEPSDYPLKKRIDALATGGVHWSPALEGGAILSRRGGDFEFTCGQDASIGYRAHDREAVELYFTESFTFRVLEPAAAVELKAK